MQHPTQRAHPPSAEGHAPVRASRPGRRAVLAAGAVGLARPAFGQAVAAYPDRPVRVVIPFAPGGANDILGRLFCAKLAERLGQPFVPENRTGAQGIVGTELVAKSRPDGHTLLVGASGPMVFNPVTYENLPYDTLRDLAPVAMLGSYPLILMVGADSPHRTLRGLVDWARANPERGTYGATNAAFQLTTELFNQRAGTRFTYVGYRGNAEVTTAVTNGELTMALLDSGPAASALASGRGRGLAVLTPGRLSAYPEVPTMAEAGMPDLEVSLWCGLAAPAGTALSILSRLQEGVAEASRDPLIRQRMAALSIEPEGGTSEQFAQRIAAETALWRDVARRGNLRFER